MIHVDLTAADRDRIVYALQVCPLPREGEVQPQPCDKHAPVWRGDCPLCDAPPYTRASEREFGELADKLDALQDIAAAPCAHEGNWDQLESGAFRCEECDELVSGGDSDA